MINPLDKMGLSTIFVPPSGHISGAFAENDEKQGIYKAAANIFIKGAVGLDQRISDKEYELLYPRGINSFKYIPGKGIKIWGARTISSESSWKYINVRRTFSVIQEALKDGTGWAVFEINEPSLRKRIVRQITAFLIEIWQEGYLLGVSPEESFFIRCDDELNPPENIDMGIITVEIGVSIAKPAEFLVIRLKGNCQFHDFC